MIEELKKEYREKIRAYKEQTISNDRTSSVVVRQKQEDDKLWQWFEETIKNNFEVKREWIDSKKDLPQGEEDVLIYDEFWKKFRVDFVFDRGNFHPWYNKYERETFWQPLPEPPSEEKGTK